MAIARTFLLSFEPKSNVRRERARVHFVTPTVAESLAKRHAPSAGFLDFARNDKRSLLLFSKDDFGSIASFYDKSDMRYLLYMR